MAFIRLNGRSKFGNRHVKIDGIRFDSMKEGRRYNELKLLERGGEIQNLELQPRFVLQESFKRDGKNSSQNRVRSRLPLHRKRSGNRGRCEVSNYKKAPRLRTQKETPV